MNRVGPVYVVRARKRAVGDVAVGEGSSSRVFLPQDLSARIGFRFFTLRLLMQRRWFGLLLPTVSPVTDAADLEECQRVVDEHMAEERRKKEKRGQDVVAEALDCDSGFSDG